MVIGGGCAPASVMTHGVPNLHQVEPGLYRSGQPTLEGWAYLQSLGVTQVVKLNDSTQEGADAVPATMTVAVLTIEPIGDKDIFYGIANTFRHPDEQKVAAAVAIMRDRGARIVLVHCTHGMDRTLIEGWSKSTAYAEMKSNGFHPILHGLMDSWDDHP